MKTDNDKKTVYIPCTAFEGFNHLQIHARYDKGEWRRPRGYYVDITAVSISDKYGIDMISWSSDSPYQSYQVELVERKNPKRFKELCERVERNAQRIADAFVAKRYDEVWQYV